MREVLVRMRSERPHYSITVVELCSLSGTIIKGELTNWLAMI